MRVLTAFAVVALATVEVGFTIQGVSAAPEPPHATAPSADSSSPSLPPIYTASFTSGPVEAELLEFVEECESSISCAGVSLHPDGTIADGGRLYRHSFVGPYRTSKTYETRKKDFTYHRGEVRISPSGEEVIEAREDVTLAQAKEICKSVLPDCVAFAYAVQSLTNLDKLPNVTFVSEVSQFVPSAPSKNDEWRTYVINDPAREGRVKVPYQLRFDGQVAKSPYSRCCNRDRENIPPMEEVVKVDTLERISCDISREEFFLKYELPRKPVMLVGCGKEWPAVKEEKWLPKNLAPRFSNHSVWRARIGGEERLDSEDYNHNARWGDVAEAMLTGKPYYIFDQLYDPEAKVIDDEYADPKPVQGGDLFKKLPYFNGPLRWFCVGPGGTGTMSHMDPYGTDAWNTVIKGHKWWIIFPEGFKDEPQLHCDPSCSVEEPLSSHWYASIGINAARSEYVVGGYGQHVLQSAGETIYIPDGRIHSVYNYGKEIIAITKNFASAANLDEVWMETVTEGDPAKWKAMYYHTLNREQRKRVRKSRYWPPKQWERDEEEAECETDQEDEMTRYPVFLDNDPEWVPEVGDLVEAQYSIDDEDGDGFSEYWTLARVTSVRDGMADISFLGDNPPNDGDDYDFQFLRPLPKEGDIVEAQLGGHYNEWYRATVVKAHPNVTWDVDYTDRDDDLDLGLARGSIREYYPFEEEEMVQVNWLEDGEEYWVDAVVTGATEDGTGVDLRRFDGKEVAGVSSTLVRRVRWEFEKDDNVAVLVNTEDEEDVWYNGRVTKVLENGRYDITLDDGDWANCKSWSDIRFQWAMEDGWDED